MQILDLTPRSTNIYDDSGAFFMRRSLGDDQLYREIFTEYTQRLLLDGTNLALLFATCPSF